MAVFWWPPFAPIVVRAKPSAPCGAASVAFVGKPSRNGTANSASQSQLLSFSAKSEAQQIARNTHTVLAGRGLEPIPDIQARAQRPVMVTSPSLSGRRCRAAQTVRHSVIRRGRSGEGK